MSEANRRRHVREKSVIDHLAKRMFQSKPAPPEDPATHNAKTETGLPVEEQVRKKWNPKKGGLPTFLKV
jgi:hypothetical protein